MISIFPHHEETFVVPHLREEVLSRVRKEVEAKLSREPQKNLTGWVENSAFQLTVRLRRQHLFMPVINGHVEATSKGAIVFLKYTLFPATRFLLLFWTILLPLLGAMISYQYNNYYVLAGCLGALSIVYLIAWSNFRLHLKNTSRLMSALLGKV